MTNMSNHIAAVFFAVLSESTTAQSVNFADPLGVEVNADPATIAVWESYYNTPTTDYEVVSGTCVPIPMTRREFFAEHISPAEQASIQERMNAPIQAAQAVAQ